LVIAFAIVAYMAEPHLFNMDDGPYYSRPFDGETTELLLYSRVELARFGQRVYVLESRLLGATGSDSVLVLRRASGSVVWQRVPTKPDGRLGPVALVPEATHMAWHGGWDVGIKPELQESGYLYLGPGGGFRFFYQSW
jgi:hypothetical protein